MYIKNNTCIGYKVQKGEEIVNKIPHISFKSVVKEFGYLFWKVNHFCALFLIPNFAKQMHYISSAKIPSICCCHNFFAQLNRNHIKYKKFCTFFFSDNENHRCLLPNTKYITIYITQIARGKNSTF